MLEWFKKKQLSEVDDEIKSVALDMSTLDMDSEEYSTRMKHLERLNGLRYAEERANRISPDTVALVVGNLVGILIIVSYEQTHVMTSKAFGMLFNRRSSS